MENFREERRAYLKGIRGSEEYIIGTLDKGLFVPGIHTSELPEILLKPLDELELNLDKEILKSIQIIHDNSEVLLRFKSIDFDNTAYKRFLDQYVAKFFSNNQVLVDAILTGRFDKNMFETLLADVRATSEMIDLQFGTDEYKKACAECSIISLFHSERIFKYINEAYTDKISKRKPNDPIGLFDAVLASCAFHGSQNDLIGQHRITVGSKSEERKCKLEDATAYLIYFQEFIKDLAARNKKHTR